MNALSPATPVPMVPGDAPFSAEQRAWLNGFLAGLYGDAAAAGASPGAASSAGAAATGEPAAGEPEDLPWHDPALALDERLGLAAGKPLARRYMAAMAQLDCGQCGYLCQTYGEALASGAETSFALCVPGARETRQALRALAGNARDEPRAPPAASPVAAVPAAIPSPPVSGRATASVRIVSAARLTGAGSAKDVRHVVIDLAGTTLRYEPGDSLAIHPANDPALVSATIAALGVDPDETVSLADRGAVPLADAFSRFVDIGRPLDRTLDLLALSARNGRHADALRRLAAGEEGEPAEPDLLDLLEAFPSARPQTAELVRSLPALKPRLYSIASSQAANPDAVHLCVSVVGRDARDRRRHGVASFFLGTHAATHGAFEAAVQPSHFRLPADDVSVVMIGPGTGIAPFRAFLQEREARGARGRNWLFFGDRTERDDYLYRDEVERWRRGGLLGRLDLAFSRDGKDKTYVQDRMRANASELWRWFEDGAHVYVCGDASRMARDVDAALRQVAREAGGLSEDDARNWTVALARARRYQRDVY